MKQNQEYTVFDFTDMKFKPENIMQDQNSEQQWHDDNGIVLEVKSGKFHEDKDLWYVR